MIGTSTFDLIFIRTCIIALHSIAPLSILYCLIVVPLYGVHTSKSLVWFTLELIALAETIFFFATLPYQVYLQREALHPPTLPKSERRELFELCNQNIPDPEAYLQTWFLGSQPDEIRRENVREFFLWAFFGRAGPAGEDDEEVEEYVEETEKLLGRRLEPGRGNAQCLRLTLDPVDLLHRSLIWYWCVSFVDFLAYVSLLRRGFHFHRTALARFFTLFPFRPQSLLTAKKSPAKHLTYWYRPHTSKTKLPVLFIHGIGIGLYPYVNFLSDINSGCCADDQVGIIAIEVMPVSFRITHPPLSKAEMCNEIKDILAYHDWDKVVLVSHSYGTIVSTHLLKSPNAPLIGSVVLIDPVSILLHLPHVAYNFTKRKPKMANEHQLRYFASMDMGVSHALARHFFWAENVLWKKDMEGRNLTVSLAGKDLIVDTKAVRQYLTSGDLSRSPSLVSSCSPTLVDVDSTHGCQVDSSSSPNEMRIAADDETAMIEDNQWKGIGIDTLWFENLDHAQVFDTQATRQLLVKAIRKYCAQDGP